MAQRDVLQTLGDIASIGNYFKLRNIGNNIGNIENVLTTQNRDNIEQNNLRNIVFNFKKALDISILQLNDYVVKSYEILSIIEYLKYYNITANLFISFLDKEYFSQFYQKLKQIEVEIKIDEKTYLNCSEINKLFLNYELLKNNLIVIKNHKGRNEIISGKRYIYAMILSLIIFVIIIFTDIVRTNAARFLILIPWVYALIKNSFADNKIVKEFEQFIKGLGIDGKYPNIDSIICLIESQITSYQNKIKQIFNEHSEFSIIHPELFNEIKSK